MLNDIYARSMLNATRHTDLQVKPVPQAYVNPPRRRKSFWRRVKSRISARAANRTPNPASCAKC